MFVLFVFFRGGGGGGYEKKSGIIAVIGPTHFKL